MSKSYQHEIPKARVNIALDVETNGATERQELPLKLLAVGDYSAGKNTETVQNRERISINKNNFDKVMQDLSPQVNLSVENTLDEDVDDLNVDLKFSSLKDFHPENIAGQVPKLKRLVAMRNLLKDIKSNLLDNVQFRHELETIFKDNPSLQGLRKELEQLTADETA